jgi:hypothetical protein
MKLTNPSSRWRPLVALVLFALPIAGAHAFPEPAIVSRDWLFDVTVDKPRPISIRDVHGETRWFWYMTYNVTNNTGDDRLFIPEITVATDEGDIVTAGQNVPASVFPAIKRKEDDGLLQSPIQIVGKLLQGRDFSRASVIVWPAFDHPVDHVDVFFAGLSGETKAIAHPTTGEEIVMRKTLMLSYDTPGGVVHPQQQPVIPTGERWIMR